MDAQIKTWPSAPLRFFYFSILYLFIKGVLFSYASSRQIYNANVWGVIFVSAFLSINFILNFTGVIDLQSLIPRARETTASYAGVFNRGYAFTTEPGIVAFYLNTLGPIALWYLWDGLKLLLLWKWVLTSLVFFGWLVTFSASGMAFLAFGLTAAVIIIGVLNASMSFRVSKVCKGGFALLIVIAIVAFLASQSSVRELLYPIYMKLTLSNEIGSSVSRVDRWISGLNMVFDKPFFGHGPGYFSSTDVGSTLSWYLMLAVEGGFITLITIIIFFGFVLNRIIRFQHPSRLAFLVGFLAGCGHLLVISTFFHPFLWLLVAIFYTQQAYLCRYKYHYYGECVGSHSVGTSREL